MVRPIYAISKCVHYKVQNMVTPTNVIDRNQLFRDYVQEGKRLQQNQYSHDLDFRDLDLSGAELSFASLQNAQFDGANLSQARFRQVDLTGASFRGANLQGAAFTLIRGSGANFAGINGSETQWDHCTIYHTDFSSAHLERARFTGCELMGSRFDQANLDTGSLLWSNLDSASFNGTGLNRVESLGVNLVDADLSNARDFAFNREFVVEILKRHTDRELPTMKWLGAIAMLRVWCYPVWEELLRDAPNYYQLALDIFARYPASGCLEAFKQPPAAAG